MAIRKFFTLSFILVLPCLAVAQPDVSSASTKVELTAQSGSPVDYLAHACSTFEKSFGASVTATIWMVVTVGSGDGNSVKIEGFCPVQNSQN